MIKALLFDITYLLLTCVTLLILCYKLNAEYWRESDNNVFIDLVIFTVCFFMLLSISSEHSEGGAEIGAERAEIAWAGAEWWAGIIESMSCERIFSRSYVLRLISDTSGEIKVTRNPSGQVRYWSITSLSITQMISDGNPFTRRRYLLYVIFITESCMILILPEPVHEGWKAESICSNNSNNKVVRPRGSQAVSHCLCCGRKDIRLVVLLILKGSFPKQLQKNPMCN